MLPMFQSPSGDSLFSDEPPIPDDCVADEDKFQSPSGDSLFSDRSVRSGQAKYAPCVSIP